jgi:predicted transcriptional regulator
MDRKRNGNIILISILPQFAKAIFNGEKKIEFRKLNVPETIKNVIMYITAPEKKIMGYFSVGMIVKACPTVLWKDYGRISGLSKEHFLFYYRNQDMGLGILLDEVDQLLNPLPLTQSGNGLRPPQSFSYVDNALWRKVKRRKKKRSFKHRLHHNTRPEAIIHIPSTP